MRESFTSHFFWSPCRHHLATTVKAHLAVRTLVLEDTETGEHLDLEGRRIGWTNAKDVIAALVTHEPAG